MKIINHRGPLMRTIQRLRSGNLTLGFIGGSITDGRMDANWPEPVTAWFADAFSDVRITVENAAIGGTNTELGVFRAQQYLVDRGADIVFVEYAVNDYDRDPKLNRQSQEGLIRKLLAAGRDVVLVYTFRQEMLADMLAGRQPKTVAAFEELAEHYKLGSVWMALNALDEVRSGLMRWQDWLPDGLHPQHRGSLSYAQAVIRYLQKELNGAAKPHGRARTTSRKGGLALPLDVTNWQGAYSLGFDKVRTQGPWIIRRSCKFAWFDLLLETFAPGAKLEFEFEGRALVLCRDLAPSSAEFRWRLDGGEPQVSHRKRHDWMGQFGGYTTDLIVNDAKAARHHFELEVIHGEQADCKGTDFKLAIIGVVP